MKIEVTNKAIELIELSRRRGSDALGITIFSEEEVFTFKELKNDNRQYKKFINRVLNSSNLQNQNVSILAHARMRTNGSLSEENTQPIQNGSVTIAHNGILINEAWFDKELSKNVSIVTDESWSDTMKAIHCLNLSDDVDKNNFEVNNFFSNFDGANNAIVHSLDLNTAFFFTTHGSLFYCQKDDLFVCGSEEVFLEETLGVKVNSFEKNVVYSLDDANNLQKISGFQETQKIEKVLPKSLVEQSTVERFEKKLIDDSQIVSDIERCTNCLMPVTTPYINMNEKGECIYCQTESKNDWKPKKDMSQLVEVLSKHKRILFPFSGGRDSSFGLAKLREIYDGEIITYTYDWGMVTDLARRNISSICGQFGIEHVLISADIEKKLTNVRKNVSAWLNRPNLGIVPLFMAGDKQYFYYINELMRERNIELTFLCSNPFERTNFKSGFCGFDVNKSKQANYHAISYFDSLKMIAFYAKQFLFNPGYLNSSLIDTASGFWSYYGIKHNYLSFFDYYQWSEEEVEQKLESDLRWEYSTDTESSWRIGDGTAPFYNYIYLNMAGLTENDALRSNQIRAGHLTREQAFKRLVSDNKNRAESLYWYFDRLGLDPFETIDKLNSKL
jgi:glutamine---fructose-6-phosphate transaminase (isomerizing)